MILKIEKRLLQKYLILLIGPLLFITLGPLNIFSMDDKIKMVVGIAAWIVIWWITEAVPAPVTALLPIVLFPILKILPLNDTAALYTHPTVFLYMAGFILALAMEQQQLHIRIALYFIKLVGTATDKIILGFMFSTGFISLWISNTAAALLMFPIAISILKLLEDEFKSKGSANDYRNFSVGLLLSLAFSSVIGGMGTVIGSPTNIVLVGYMKDLYHVDVSFMGWVLIVFPFALILLLVAYIILTKIFFKVQLKSLEGISNILDEKISELGPMTYQQYAVTIIFVLTALGWILRSFVVELLGMNFLNDTIIGMAGALLLFLIPDQSTKTGFLFDWKSMDKLAWGILLLIGGGLALGKALENSGVIKMIGDSIAATGSNNYLYVLAMVIGVASLLTQFMGNTALNTIALPMVFGIANATGVSPIILGVATTLAVSLSFTLPMSTPPMAIVFTGEVRIRDMMKSGALLAAVGIIMLLLYAKAFAWIL